ncbi:MAG TPA: UvrB/UvrC motif-containing protein [Gemmataceae bacterium]|nr:UvrB/UvrC motif-containing protein [Gemmataceae bacterium]
MEGLFSPGAFTGFGPAALDPADGPPPLHHIYAARPAGLRARVRQQCPRRPGVYGMVDGHGELIYVGKAKCLRTRLLSYFRAKGRDPRAGKILEHARHLVWEYAPSEFAALLRELELIRRWRPRFNIKDQPRRQRRLYVCLGRRPAPYVFLASRPPAGAVACYGPVPAGRAAAEAVRRVNDWFRLRDCPRPQEMVFAEQRELFPLPRAAGCVRHEIGTCLGPCAAACTHAVYAGQVGAARAFLEGKDLSPLEALERAMAEAAAALAFERAAALRDQVEALRWLHTQLERLRWAQERYSFVYPVSGHDGDERWYLIRQGQVVAAAAAPCDEVSRRTMAAHIEAVYWRQPARPLPPAAGAVDSVLLVVAWFRHHPNELARVLDPAQALDLCRSASRAPVGKE